ncbi:MAG TPA: DUF1127 domain-containing protein, partial [Geminicoccaceae bacterium]
MRALAPVTRMPVTAARRPAAATGLTRLLDSLTAWLEVRRQRRHLLGMSDSMLRDIGLSRADAERE